MILKEGRPFTDTRNSEDRICRLEREFRLLNVMAPHDVAPEPIETFYEWEHFFVAEEYVPGATLGKWIVARSPLGLTYPSDKVVEDYLASILEIWSRLAELVVQCHENNVVCGDLSPLNLIISPETGKLKMVDWEGSWQESVDNPPGIYTPGQQLAKPTCRADDVYSMGTLMVNTLWPVTTFFDAAPEKRLEITQFLGDGLRVPKKLQAIILDCLEAEPAKRPTAADVTRRLKDWSQSNRTITLAPPRVDEPVTPEGLSRIVLSIAECTNRVADFKHVDRLYPGDAMQFTTNPVSFAYGATGVASALHRITGEVDGRVLHWILSKADPERVPPGLFIGLAGVACLMSQVGLDDVAEKIVTDAATHPLVSTVQDLYSGASGVGMASLVLFEKTRSQRLLDIAVKMGDRLVASAIERDEGRCWMDEAGKVNLSYGRGIAGICSYLLYLSLATRDAHYGEYGTAGLQFLSNHLRETPEGFTTLVRGSVGDFKNVQMPSWFEGSAGVVGVFLRYWLVYREPMWLQLFNQMLPDVFRQYMPFPDFFVGTAGLGSALLDAYRWTEESRYLEEAMRAAQGILPYAVSLPEGTAFPGEQLWRLSTDFATGSAGIAYFLEELRKCLNGIMPSSLLQPDGLLEEYLTTKDH